MIIIFGSWNGTDDPGDPGRGRYRDYVVEQVVWLRNHGDSSGPRVDLTPETVPVTEGSMDVPVEKVEKVHNRLYSGRVTRVEPVG